MTYSRVLVGTDLSDGARAAFAAAQRLAHPRTRYRAALVLQPSWPAGRRSAKDRERVVEALRSWTQDAGVPDAGQSVLEGGIARELAREARGFGADLVVVGSRGQGRRRILGSVARSLVRSAEIDALVVRGRIGAPIERILVATDFHESSLRAIHRARDVAKHVDAELYLLHAIDPGIAYDPLGAQTNAEVRDALRDLNEREMGGKARPLIVRGRPPPEVARVARERDIDLVVIGNHGAGPLERAMLGSVAESIVERAPCSVLVVRA